MEEKGVIVIAPDNKRIHQDLAIPESARGDAVHGDIVVAEIVEQPSRHTHRSGKWLKCLASIFKLGWRSICRCVVTTSRLNGHKKYLMQANVYSPLVQEADKMGRKDVTRLPLVTIDGEDARDFDDAVYCEKQTAVGACLWPSPM